MKLPITTANKINEPLKGFGFAFIDAEDKKLKVKKYDSIIEFNNNLSDVQLLDLTNYTAFEVYAHDTDIPVGECEELGGYVSNVIPASLKHKMKIRTNHINEEMSDVIIDWGDGNYSKISNGDYVSSDLNVEDMECDYTVEHDYKETGKYIIKIYGKQYYNIQGLSNSDANRFKYNLICRAFAHDLPISKNLTNLAGFLKNSNHILNIVIPSYFDLSQVTNYYTLFSECHNLLSVKGLKNKVINVNAANTIFYNCKSLKYLEYTLPSFTVEKSGIANSFYNVTLSCDINDLMPKQDFIGLEYDVTRLFTASKYLTGIVPANKLWNNKNIKWVLPTNEKLLPFYNCSDELRSQVPVSWGGTNKYIDFQLKHKDEIDYTTFEVFAHDYDIIKGTKVKDTALSACILTDELLEETFLHDVPASMMHVFAIRSKQAEEINDIEIDWGDQSSQSLSEAKLDVLQSGSEFIYLVGHTYKETGFYKVSIYGKNYFSFCNQSAYTWQSGTYTNNNIMCRVLSDDLPVASWVSNFSSLARTNRHILEVELSSKINMLNGQLTFAFKSCLNLLRATGFGMSLSLYSAYDCFNSCGNLLYTDLCLQFSCKYSAINRGVFGHCKRLALNIANVFPSTGFVGNNVDVHQLFLNCQKMTGTVPANKLWNNKNINWTNTGSTFSGCSSEIRSQVPVSWGGTALDDIIEQ